MSANKPEISDPWRMLTCAATPCDRYSDGAKYVCHAMRAGACPMYNAAKERPSAASTAEACTAYNAGVISALEKELLSPWERSRVGSLPAWARSVITDLIRRIANLRAANSASAEPARVLGKIATWFEAQADRSDATASKSSRFSGLAEACRADAKNYRAMAKEARAALATQPAKG